MDTLGQIGGHASSSMPSQSDHKLEDEVCEEETHDDVPSHREFHPHKLHPRVCDGIDEEHGCLFVPACLFPTRYGFFSMC